jgi:Secretion system C-terminal sorting domain
MKAQASILAFFIFCAISTTFAQINPQTNVISVDVSTFPQNPLFNYDSCFSLGVKAGMKSVGLFQNWTAIETAPNVYNLAIMDIANQYYPANNMPVDLTITPIHTNNLELPSDLVNTAFDNPVLINRFKTLLDSVRKHTPNLELSSLVIGSEHDVYLGSNAQKWTQYTTFYNAVLTYAKTLWPGLNVATELTFNGIISQSALTQALNTNSDYIGISYYPLKNDFTVKPVTTIPTDFATLVGLFPSKPLVFYQYGYPSSPVCNSSETKQAQFIEQTFSSWDVYSGNIKKIDFTWIHDLDSALVAYYSTYYGLSDPVFLEYLRTIGLRTWNGKGTSKAAFLELQCQAKQRGFNNLNLNCTTGIVSSEHDPALPLSIFPNPAYDFVSLVSQRFLKETIRVSLFSSFGKKVKTLVLSSQSARIKVGDLQKGLYFIQTDEIQNRMIPFIKE